MSRLKNFYQNKVIPRLKKELNFSNIMEVPRVKKITLNMGVGTAPRDKKDLELAVDELTIIAGQRAVKTLSRKSIAGFKIRNGWPIGSKVTLRKNRMYEFFDRLITIVIPRIRDFRGFPLSSFDSCGNYNLGIREQIAFPEIQYDKINKIRGLDIAITTTAVNRKHGEALLKAFNFPLKKF